jgi:hypothetical protein
VGVKWEVEWDEAMGGRLVRAEFPDGVRLSTHHITVADGDWSFYPNVDASTQYLTELWVSKTYRE